MGTEVFSVKEFAHARGFCYMHSIRKEKFHMSIYYNIYMTNAREMRGTVRGVTPVRDIRMRERAYSFNAHFRVRRGERTVLY
jgi:hypothetical protein